MTLERLTLRGQKWKSSYSRTLSVTGTETSFGKRTTSPAGQKQFQIVRNLKIRMYRDNNATITQM